MTKYLKMNRTKRWWSNHGNAVARLALAVPLALMMVGGGTLGTSYQVAVAQQDAEDATAGAAGEDGTINGRPRDTGEDTAPVVTGPGVPLPPPEVNLPPSVPGVVPGADPGATAPGADPALAPGVAQTSELVFNAVSDTTVFSAEPGAPQTQESAGLLAVGGPQGAVSLISFDVSGVAGGTVLSALLNFTGAASSPGGGVSVIYNYVAPDGLTANEVPGGEGAVNFHGVPAWFDRLEEGGLTSVDVSGSVYGDGAITFVLQGEAQKQGLIYAVESGVTPQLVLTVSQPA